LPRNLFCFNRPDEKITDNVLRRYPFFVISTLDDLPAAVGGWWNRAVLLEVIGDELAHDGRHFGVEQLAFF